MSKESKKPSAPEPKPAAIVTRPGYLMVSTNPYAAADHLGRPCGACPVDPFDPRFYDPRRGNDVRGYVGAKQVFGDVTRPTPAHSEAHRRTERRDLQWEFLREPFEVPDTQFYRARIAEGVLIDSTTSVTVARALTLARGRCKTEPRWV
jgi:hypothetical protein